MNLKIKTFLLCVFCFGCVKAQKHKLQIELKPTEFIIQKFNSYSIVALGEIHGLKDMHQLYETIIKNENFQKNVQNVVLEYANSKYQTLIDDYTAGKDISLKTIRKVWRNLFVAPFTQYAVDEFEHLFISVRNINKGKPLHKQIRILAGGLPVDWKEITSVNDYMNYRKSNSRDRHYGKIVLENILDKGKKALLISGTVHLKKGSVLTKMLEKQYKESIYYVFPMTNFAGRNQEIMTHLQNPNKPILIQLKNSWLADVNKPSVSSNANANIKIKKLRQNDLDKEGDLIIERGIDGKKRVMQLTKTGKITLATEGIDKMSENFNTMFLRFAVGSKHRILGEDSGNTLFDIADAILLVSNSKMILPENLWTDDEFWNTLDKRLQMLTGEKLDPRVRSSKGKFDNNHH